MRKRDQDRRFKSCFIGILSLTAACFFPFIAAAKAKRVAASTPIGPAGYTFCSNEYETCNFSGTASVAYGANGVFVYKILTNGTPCSNAIFGDPLYGTVKACFYQIQPPSLQFGSSSYNVAENSASIAVTVTRTQSSSGAVSASYAFSNGTAMGGTSCTEGVDYINTGGTISFADSDTAAKVINVTLCNDAGYDGDEYFYIYLSNPTGGASIGGPNYAQVIIRDDESLLRLSSSSYYGSEADSTIAVVVTRGGNVGVVSVLYSLSDGTAIGGASCTAGVDYINTGGTIGFADGDSADKTITVELCNDSTVESIEALNITLSNPTGNVTLGSPSTAPVVIRDPGAATFTVNVLGDAGDGVCDATCTLRDALDAANGENQSDDTIVFDSSIFAAPQTITLTNWLFIVDDVTIDGPGADLLSVSGNNSWSVFGINQGVTATLDGMTIRDGVNYYGAGGVSNWGTLTVSNLIVTGNTGYDSYGVGVYNGGTMTMNNSTVSGNYGYVWDWGSAGSGILNEGTLTVKNSTISGNTAEWGYGGGIFNYGTLTIADSTVSGNAAYYGGGVYTYGGTLKINNGTISGNTAYSGGGIYSETTNETLRNTIVGGNTTNGSFADIYGTIETASHNLIGDAGSSSGIVNGVNGNIVGINPLLGSLRNNGGATRTHALLAASPAVNAGDNCVLTENGCGDGNPALTTDQRGMQRNGSVDIGAFERQPSEPSATTLFDFDGDGKADISVWRPSTGEWWTLRSSNGSYTGRAWGIATDVPIPADYDGDGKTDAAIWSPSTGEWRVVRSSDSAVASRVWGVETDGPVPADYDGDGKADVAVWRPSTGEWWVLRSSDGTYTGRVWGVETDKPVVGDYDGDGKADIAVWRPSTGEWWVLRSSDGTYTGQGWGLETDKPVNGDFDGDGKTDIAVWRPSTGEWWVLRSSDGTYTGQVWGVATDIPIPADYDGDGKTDIAVFRPSTGEWWVLRSGDGTYTGRVWGVSSDIPIPNVFLK